MAIDQHQAFFRLEQVQGIAVLRLQSADGANLLTRGCVLSLIAAMQELARDAQPLIIAGNRKFLSAGADLSEIASLTGPEAFEFAKLGQRLMAAIEQFSVPVYAAISGYCMGGGLDIALACHHRIASPDAVFGHRGAALGLLTGWGGTQRLPRLVGKARALQMFVAAERIPAGHAQEYGLVDVVAEDPVAEAIRRIQRAPNPTGNSGIPIS